MPARASVEFQCVAADDFFPSEVGPAQAAGDHAPEVTCGLDQRDFQAMARRADGGDYTACRAAVDGDVEFLGVEGETKKRGGQDAAFHDHLFCIRFGVRGEWWSLSPRRL